MGTELFGHLPRGDGHSRRNRSPTPYERARNRRSTATFFLPMHLLSLIRPDTGHTPRFLRAGPCGAFPDLVQATARALNSPARLKTCPYFSSSLRDAAMICSAKWLGTC